MAPRDDRDALLLTWIPVRILAIAFGIILPLCIKPNATCKKNLQ